MGGRGGEEQVSVPDVTAPFAVHVCVCTHMHVCISVCDAAASGWAERLSVSPDTGVCWC